MASKHKRSVSVQGRGTSVSLEDEFWDALTDIAAAEAISRQMLISRIGRDRSDANRNLSSCIRIFVLDYFRSRSGLTPKRRRSSDGC